MGVNICRRFMPHNDLVPPIQKVHNWDYLAFGYYDGMSIGENIFQVENTNLNVMLHDCA